MRSLVIGIFINYVCNSILMYIKTGRMVIGVIKSEWQIQLWMYMYIHICNKSHEQPFAKYRKSARWFERNYIILSSDYYMPDMVRAILYSRVKLSNHLFVNGNGPMAELFASLNTIWYSNECVVKAQMMLCALYLSSPVAVLISNAMLLVGAYVSIMGCLQYVVDETPEQKSTFSLPPLGQRGVQGPPFTNTY